jgi:biopolymer transport protein ExbB
MNCIITIVYFKSNKMFDIFSEGGMGSFFSDLGFNAYPLTACILLALTVILERVIFLLQSSPIALKMPLKHVNPGNRIIFHLVDELVSIRDLPKTLREEVLMISLSLAKKKLFAGIAFVGFIGSIAPMFGLLGNVLGMLHSFTEVAKAGSISPVLVASGLKEAMYTTAVGLVIAIPCMFAEFTLKGMAERRFSSYYSYLMKLNLDIEAESL